MKKILAAFLVLGAGVLIGLASGSPIFGLKKSTPRFSSQSQDIQEIQEEGPLLGVVVENSPEARPISGLSLADLAFEAPTEGGITRILAFYRENSASKVGPVRSARPYFVDWAAGLTAVFGHSGGSKEALEKITALAGAFRDLNEFYNEKYFWRDKSAIAPHNLFTSTKLLADAARSKNWDEIPPDFGWEVKSDGSIAASPQIAKIDIDFSFDAFDVTYEYDQGAKNYRRIVAGKPDIDPATNKQVAAKNVVVLYTQSRVIDPKLLTIALETLGSGQAVIFRGGQILRARWQKTSPESPLRLVDADGSQITLSAGPTWFAVIDQQGSASWK